MDPISEPYSDHHFFAVPFRPDPPAHELHIKAVHELHIKAAHGLHIKAAHGLHIRLLMGCCLHVLTLTDSQIRWCHELLIPAPHATLSSSQQRDSEAATCTSEQTYAQEPCCRVRSFVCRVLYIFYEQCTSEWWLLGVACCTFAACENRVYLLCCGFIVDEKLFTLPQPSGS